MTNAYYEAVAFVLLKRVQGQYNGKADEEVFTDATGKQVWQYIKTIIEEPLIDFINKYEKKRGPPN